MSIGEPQHAPPEFVLETLRRSLDRSSAATRPRAGLPQLRAACAAWLTRRYGLKEGSVDPDTMVLPVNGTREALFAFVQAAIDRAQRTARGACPIRSTRSTRARRCWPAPSRTSSTPRPRAATSRIWPRCRTPMWQRCQVLFLCSPGNPSGAVLPLEFLSRALDLAERHDFIVASDECYADIYLDEAAPPPGLLEAAEAAGRTRFERCVVFHSLSKRSSLPGLRSGFVAGDPALHRALSALPHLPRQRHAGADAARQHRRLARRCARPREPPPLPGEVRARAAAARPVLGSRAPRRAPSTCGRTSAATMRTSPASCTRGRTSPCCRAATWRAPARAATPARSACASRSCRRSPSASRPPSASANSCVNARPVRDCAAMSELDQLQRLIESRLRAARASSRRSNMSDDLDDAIAESPGAAGLRHGARRRTAARAAGCVNEWLKKAVLLVLPHARQRAHRRHGYTNFYDKVPLKYAHASEAQLRAGGARIVPHAIVRHGAYIAPNVVLMPSYVNIGAYVGTGTMVDTWATVGSCAQIGRNVHLSGGVGIGGVLEPLQAAPTIIEDDCFIGARSEIVEGVIVERRLRHLHGRVHRPEHAHLRPHHAARSCAGGCRRARWWSPGRCPPPTASTASTARSSSSAWTRRPAPRPRSTSCCAAPTPPEARKASALSSGAAPGRRRLPAGAPRLRAWAPIGRKARTARRCVSASKAR